ncbi:MAG: serine hydrolase domain-containing protein [Salibacteraceae bacterium]
MRYERYWEKYGPKSHSNSFSMAKSIVSALIGVAIGEGHIQNIDQPIGDFLPEYKEGKRAAISIRHLLTMSSGIGFGESYINPLSYPARANYGTNLRELVYSYDVEYAPGEVFFYTSGNSQLLAFVLEAATGKRVSEYASEKLWGPMRAETTAMWSLDKEGGDEKAFCCFHSNARDFARMGQLYLNGGQWDGQQLVPADFVAESIQLAPLKETDGSDQKRYGLHWWLLEHRGHEVFYMRGLAGQYVMVIPQLRMLVVRLGHKREHGKGYAPPVDAIDWLDTALDMYDDA